MRTFTVERPELRSAIRRYIVPLCRIQARIAGSLARQYRPTTVTIDGRACQVPTHVCTAEDELLVDSCFDKGVVEALGYENVDEPVRLDTGDVRERWWRRYRSLLDVACLIRIPSSRSVICVCVGGRKETVARV